MKLLKKYAPGITIIAVDSEGIIHRNREHLNAVKQELLDENIIEDNEEGN